MGGCVHVTIKRERVLIQKEKEQGQVMKYVCPKKGEGYGEKSEEGLKSGIQIQVLST